MPSHSDASSLALDADGDSAVVRILGTDFGEVTAERLLSLVGKVNQPVVTLDFGSVTFLGSMGMAMLVRLNKDLAAKGRRLAIVNVRPHIYEMFTVTGLDHVLDLRQREAAEPASSGTS
jgi:anti-anti-sigma factor